MRNIRLDDSCLDHLTNIPVGCTRNSSYVHTFCKITYQKYYVFCRQGVRTQLTQLVSRRHWIEKVVLWWDRTDNMNSHERRTLTAKLPQHRQAQHSLVSIITGLCVNKRCLVGTDINTWADLRNSHNGEGWGTTHC